MPIIENKPISCEDCGYVFDDLKKYHARNRCNPCYQSLYMRGKLPIKKVKETNCSKCGFEFGTLNQKGRAVIKGSKGLCKTCYSRDKKPKKECTLCGNMMLAGSNTGLCIICREDKRTKAVGKRSYKRKVKPIPFLEPETYEAIRRILVRFKYNNNTLVDNFRVADLYIEINEDAILLDTLTEEAQVIEMLRYLKKVYDFNKEDRANKLTEAENKAIHKAKYYKYQKKEKKVNKTADMKAYRKEYYQKNYANGGYIKYLIKREAKN